MKNLRFIFSSAKHRHIYIPLCLCLSVSICLSVSVSVSLSQSLSQSLCVSRVFRSLTLCATVCLFFWGGHFFLKNSALSHSCQAQNRMMAGTYIHYPHVLQHSAVVDHAIKWERVNSKKGISAKFDSSGRFCAFLNADGTVDLWETSAIPRFAYRLLQNEKHEAYYGGSIESGILVWSSDSQRLMTTCQARGRRVSCGIFVYGMWFLDINYVI